MKKNPARFSQARAFLNRRSIRSRIFSYFLFFTALLLVLLWIFQTVLLDDFYKYQKTNMLTSSAEAIAHNIENNDIRTLISRISEQNDVCVLVLDQWLRTLVAVDASPGCVIHNMSLRDLSRFMRSMEQSDEVVLHVFSLGGFRNSRYDAARFSGYVPPADDGNIQSMIAARQVLLSDGQKVYIFLNAIITPVTATVETLRSQLVFISLVLVLLSFLISFLLSHRITQPIVETTLAARALSVGEFTPSATRTAYREVDELNLQLTQAAQDLQKVEGMQRELIANISHDLRTPLTLIEGYAEAIRDLPGENKPENMQVIIDETKRLATLVNAVLDYSTTKNGQNPLSCEDFDLTASILAILARYQKLTGQEGYQIDFHYEDHITVCADELRVGQVIYNLINNALTYTGPDKRVTVTQNVENGQAKIEVHDSGEGISPEELPHIWNRYYRGSKPHKRAAIGSGLGLSIVQGVLENHALPYGVESGEGAGTTFWFLIPVVKEENA